MSALKKIFTLKSNTPKTINKQTEEDIKQIKLTFFESGYGSSKQADGNHIVFRACLEDVYMDYKGKCRENDKLQNELKAPYIELAP